MTEFLLGEICEFINGGAWSDKEYVDTGIPVLKVSNCKPSGFVIDEINYLPFESEEKYQRNKLKVGDVIIATVGSHPNLVDSAAGRTCIVTHLVEGFFLNQNAVCVRTGNPDILDQSYLGYFSKTQEFQHYIQMKGRGAANQMRIAIGSIKEFRIKLPPIEVQKKIAVFLSRYDELLENNQKQIKLLEEAAQRLYKEWFVDLHFPGWETTPIIDGIPEGWTEVSMADVCDTVGGGTPSTKVEAYYCGGKIKWVTPTDITRKNSLILLDSEKKITEEGLKYSSAKIVPPYTILMTSRASIGYFGLCEREVCTNQGFISCIPNKENYRYFLLYNLMNRVEEIRSKASGSTFLEISKKAFREFVIILPSNNVLDDFAKMINPVIRHMEALTKSIAQLQEARYRLLPKLMNGEIET